MSLYLSYQNAVIGPDGSLVDSMLTPSGATYAAHALNVGASHVEPHRIIGTRVQPGAPRELAARTLDRPSHTPSVGRAARYDARPSVGSMGQWQTRHAH